MMVVQLANYLVMQGYKPSEITLLPAYSAQLHEISEYIRRRRLSDQLKGIVLRVLDNVRSLSLLLNIGM